MTRLTPRRIVLIGAARSGTKIVRDVLSAATGVGRVPYDISYVWRYGNESCPDDALHPTSLTPGVSRFITQHVDRYAGGDPATVIEKTVGNTLRVPFVHRVMPDAAFVHLIRHGVDVAESTRRQWIAPPDAPYLLKKIRHFPLRLMPTYGRKYAVSVAKRYLNSTQHFDTWGPRYPGIDDDVRNEDLLTVCARQWQSSVEHALDAFATLDVLQVDLRYERLMAQPAEELARVISTLGLDVGDKTLDKAARMLEPGRSGTGARALNENELTGLQVELGSTLERLGYPPTPLRGVPGEDFEGQE